MKSVAVSHGCDGQKCQKVKKFHGENESGKVFESTLGEFPKGDFPL